MPPGRAGSFAGGILRSLPEAVVLDTLGRIRHLNHAAERLLGWSEAEACGAIAEDLNPLE